MKPCWNYLESFFSKTKMHHTFKTPDLCLICQKQFEMFLKDVEFIEDKIEKGIRIYHLPIWGNG